MKAKDKTIHILNKGLKLIYNNNYLSDSVTVEELN